MSKKQKLNYSKRPVKIGKRNLNEVLSQVINKNFFKVLLNFFKIHQNPIRAIFNEFFSLGKYPTTIFLKKKNFKIKIFSIHDFSTFNLVFCRKDYLKTINDKIIVDIGSNIGITALYWIYNNNKCKVYLYEPSIKNFKKLKANCKPFKNIFNFNNFGISNKSGLRKLYLSPSGVNDTFMKKEAMSNNTQIAKVKSINKILKAILKKHNIIDILKIDVEGEEFKIIRSIYKKYLKKIKIINVEGKGFDKILPYYFKCTIQGSASRFVNSFLN